MLANRHFPLDSTGGPYTVPPDPQQHVSDHALHSIIYVFTATIIQIQHHSGLSLPFLCTGRKFTFSNAKGDIPFLIEDVKTSRKGLETKLTHTFIMSILIIL